MREHFQFHRDTVAPPAGLYFYAFSRSDLKCLKVDVRAALNRMGGLIIELDCAGKQYREILSELLDAFGISVGSAQRRYEAMTKILSTRVFTLLLISPSQMKEAKAKKLKFVKEMVQFFTDDHFTDGQAKNHIVIVDAPSFLEAGEGYFQHLLEPVAVQHIEFVAE
jgi:hypothetical protein